MQFIKPKLKVDADVDVMMVMSRIWIIKHVGNMNKKHKKQQCEVPRRSCSSVRKGECYK